MDETDERIIEELSNDSRSSNVDIGRTLGISEGSVRSRIKRLVESGVISKFTVRTQGRGIKAVVDIRVNVNTNTDICAGEIAKINGIQTVFEVSGQDDIVAVVDVATSSELNDIIEDIRRIDSITSTRTRVILREHWRR